MIKLSEQPRRGESAVRRRPAEIGPVTVDREGREFVLRCEMWLPRRKDEIFPFFADARNLERITPGFLRFKVMTPGPVEMREGALIDYRLKVRGVPIGWRTRIAAWDPPHRFVDEQIKGPYLQWIHEHTFEDDDGGTLCRDVVRYRVPGGRLVNALVVERDVKGIFRFRQETLARMFG
ncbi:MAG: SRPBCC family protein [Planctomycetota bacterium]|nr:SRPBCC family protein [Planctomycetota bacterium]